MINHKHPGLVLQDTSLTFFTFANFRLLNNNLFDHSSYNGIPTFFLYVYSLVETHLANPV